MAAKQILLLACILLSFFTVAGAHAVNQPEGSKKSGVGLRAEKPQRVQEPLIDRRGTDTAPLAIKILPAEDAKSKAIEEKKDRDEHTATENRLTRATEWLAGVTLALAVLSALQVGLFFWQLKLIRRSVDEAKKATNAAIESVAVARENSQKELRAYVHNSLPKIIFVNDASGKQTPAIRVDVKNFGRTPAYDVRGWVGIVVLRENEQLDENSFRSLIDDPTISRDCLPPDTTMVRTVATRIPLPTELLALVFSPRLTIYAYGEFHYKDVYNKLLYNKLHVTQFRSVNGGPDGLGGQGLVACPDGNEAT